MAANGTGPLVFIDDETAGRSSRKKPEVYRAVLSAQSKLIGRYFTVQMDNDPKHTLKATQELLNAKNWNIRQWPSQSLLLTEHAFHFLKTKLRAKRPTVSN